MTRVLTERVLAILLGVVLDALIGDPHKLPHPVQAMGMLIGFLEKQLRSFFHLPDPEGGKAEGPKNRKMSSHIRRRARLAGVLEVLLVTVISTAVPVLILFLAGWIWPPLRWILSGIFFGQMYARRSLRDESMKVRKYLYRGNVEGARRAVSMIVGRDTAHLTAEEIAKAAVETVAENTSDGVIAPLLFMAAFGAPGVYFYKAVNTMDSMIGYKTERYRDFGTAAARLDDVLNFLPSRISALLMIAAAFFAGEDVQRAWLIFRRDRMKHESPNSAQTESVCAGALHIELGGDAWYFGELHRKQTLGDPIRQVEEGDIRRANRLMDIASLLALLLVIGILLLLLLIV